MDAIVFDPMDYARTPTKPAGNLDVEPAALPASPAALSPSTLDHVGDGADAVGATSLFGRADRI
jgi:hypothetical protein